MGIGFCSVNRASGMRDFTAAFQELGKIVFPFKELNGLLDFGEIKRFDMRDIGSAERCRCFGGNQIAVLASDRMKPGMEL